IYGQHFEPAKKIIDAVVGALSPLAVQYPRTHALAVQLQQSTGQLLSEPDSTGADRGQKFRSPHRARRYWLILAVVALVTVVVAGSAIHFSRPENGPSVGAVVMTETPSAKAEQESLPPVASGQRYPREYVRYCHFQQERLRTVKQRLRSQEDVRAYNALATDW